MNKYLFFIRKFMAWGNLSMLRDLNENPKQGWWESFGWGEKE